VFKQFDQLLPWKTVIDNVAFSRIEFRCTTACTGQPHRPRRRLPHRHPNAEEEGLREIAAMHQRLLDNLHLATSVFMMGDIQAARSLLAEKDRMRDLEQAATDNHLRRLRMMARPIIPGARGKSHRSCNDIRPLCFNSSGSPSCMSDGEHAASRLAVRMQSPPPALP
jgi:hypothetical protein